MQSGGNHRVVCSPLPFCCSSGDTVTRGGQGGPAVHCRSESGTRAEQSCERAVRNAVCNILVMVLTMAIAVRLWLLQNGGPTMEQTASLPPGPPPLRMRPPGSAASADAAARLASIRRMIAAHYAATPRLTAIEMQKMTEEGAAVAAAERAAARVAAAAPAQAKPSSDSASHFATPIPKPRARLHLGDQQSRTSFSVASSGSSIGSVISESSAIAASSIASAHSFGSSHSGWCSSISDSCAQISHTHGSAVVGESDTVTAMRLQARREEEEDDAADDAPEDECDDTPHSSDSGSGSELNTTWGKGAAIIAASLSSSASSSSCAPASRRRSALVHPQRLLPPVANHEDFDQQQKYSCCSKKCWNKPKYGVEFVANVRSVTVMGDRTRAHR